jgi:hypothetical protein
MMRLRKFSVIATFCLFAFHCGTNSNRYSIEIRHFAGAWGLTVYYLVSDKAIQVDTDCDFQNCKRKTVYKRDLTKELSDSLFEVLLALRLDTLKESYEPQLWIADGLNSTVKIRGTKFPNKDVSIDNVNVPARDTLYNVIDRLILTKKYQFHHFGEQ